MSQEVLNDTRRRRHVVWEASTIVSNVRQPAQGGRRTVATSQRSSAVGGGVLVVYWIICVRYRRQSWRVIDADPIWTGGRGMARRIWICARPESF